MKKIFFFFLILFNTYSKEIFTYHCGFKENSSGELKNIWATDLLGPYEWPELGTSYDQGSFIFNGTTGICMMVRGGQSENFFEFYVNFYEGDNLNLAPGVCSFLGALGYKPFGLLSQANNELISADYKSHVTGERFLVFSRVLENKNEFMNDKCEKELTAYLK